MDHTKLIYGPVRRLAPTPLLLFVLLAVLSHADLSLGQYAFVDFYDTLEVHFGHFRNMADLWRRYGFFGWYPFNAGGVPSFVGQHPPYHPAVFLSMVLPVWALAALWNLGQLIMAGWGMHRLLRQFFGASDEIATACAAIFATSFVGSNIHIVFAYAFPAFAVWTLEAFSIDFSRGTRALRAFGLVLIAMISFPVLTLPHFPALHLLLVLFFGRSRADYTRQVGAVFLVWTGYVLIFVPSIVSLFLFIPLAQRDWGFPTVTMGHAIKSFLGVFWSRTVELHVFPALLFSIPLLRKRRDMRPTFAMIVFFLAVAAMFGSDAKNFLANTFVVKMDLFLTTMVAQIAAFLFICQGMMHLKNEEAIPRSSLLLGAASVVLVRGEYAMLRMLFAYVAWLSLLHLVRRMTHVPEQRRVVLFIALLAAGLSGMVMMDRQQYMTATTFVPYARGYAERPVLSALEAEEKNEPFRVAEVDLHPAMLQSHGLDTVGGKGPLFNKYYKQYVRAAIAPQLAQPELAKGFDSVWRQLYLTHSQRDHDRRPLELPGPERRSGDFSLSLFESLNVRYLVSARPMKDLQNHGELVATDAGVALPAWVQGTWLGATQLQPLWVYRLGSPSGLGSLRSVDLVQDRTAVQAWLLESSPEHLRRSVALARADFHPDSGELMNVLSRTGPAKGRVELLSWSPDRLLFQCDVEDTAVLYVPNNYDPNWRATINGEPAPVLLANGAFQAVPISGSGAVRVELCYRNALLPLLHVATLLGVLLMFLGLLPKGAPLPGQVMEKTDHQEMLPFAPRLCALAGAGVAVVWLAGFLLFVFRKSSVMSPGHDALIYALGAIPLLGIGTGLWTAFLVRRL